MPRCAGILGLRFTLGCAQEPNITTRAGQSRQQTDQRKPCDLSISVIAGRSSQDSLLATASSVGASDAQSKSPPR